MNILTGTGSMIKNYEALKLLFSIILIFGLFSCAGKKAEPEEETKTKPEVKTGSPSRQNMVDYLTFNGNTTFLSSEIIRATFSGYIEKVNKNIGDKLLPGDNIFIIRTKEASAIDSSGNLSADIKFKGSVKINAKTTGTLIKMFYHLGDYVMDGDQLAQLAAPQSLRISLNVPFKFMKVVTGSGNITVVLPDGRKLKAKIGKIIPSIDQTTQTQTIILTMNDNVDLPDNLNVTVLIPGRTTTDAVALPKSAIQTDETQNEFWVMKLVNDSIAVKIKVKKGIENPQFVQIIEPQLDLNDKFIIDGAYGLEDSTKIKISGK